jgi:hypothetical protein
VAGPGVHRRHPSLTAARPTGPLGRAQRAEETMIHPDTELRFINPTMGYGVVATRLIPAGTITWTRDALDQTIPEHRVRDLRRELQANIEKYAYQDRHGSWVLCWDLARYVNHSCEANCLSPGWDFEIAVRDIEVGEELTDDYGCLNLHEPFACSCGAPSCRETILPDDPVRLAQAWDVRLAPVFRRLLEVEQPLWPLVRSKGSILRRLEGGRAPLSSLRNFLTHPPSQKTPPARSRRRRVS